jgi:hypothetical protein
MNIFSYINVYFWHHARDFKFDACFKSRVNFIYFAMSSYYLSLAKWVCVACAVDDLWKADTFTLFTSRLSAMQRRAKEYTQEYETETAIILLIARLMCVNNLREQKCITTALRRPRQNTQVKYKVHTFKLGRSTHTTERETCT